jgi:apolipoprotein N-acyltransferase
MSNLLTAAYWFSFEAREFMPIVKWSLLAFFGLMILAGLVLRALAKKRSGNLYWSEGGRRFSRLCFVMGLFGLLFLWLTHELIYFFGARFWFALWDIATIVWAVFILKYMMKEIPKRASEFAEKARIEKYLPKSK